MADRENVLKQKRLGTLRYKTLLTAGPFYVNSDDVTYNFSQELLLRIAPK